MSDDRTPEQRDADTALHAAIQQAARAYELPADAFITDWVVVGHALRADDDGDRHHDFTLVTDNGQRMSDSLLLGMLRTATLRADRSYLEDLR